MFGSLWRKKVVEGQESKYSMEDVLRIIDKAIKDAYVDWYIIDFDSPGSHHNYKRCYHRERHERIKDFGEGLKNPDKRFLITKKNARLSACYIKKYLPEFTITEAEKFVDDYNWGKFNEWMAERLPQWKKDFLI